LLQETAGAESVLQVWIHLDSLVELLTLDLNEGRGHRLHVGPGAGEGDPAAADRIPVLVCVDASVHHASEQVIEDPGQDLRIQHAMEGSHKHGLLGVEFLLGMLDVVAVIQDPGDDLNLLAPHPPAGDLEVICSVALGTLRQQVGDMSLVIKDNVDIALGRRGRLILPRPLNPDWTKLTKGLDQGLLRHIPRHSTKEDLAAVDGGSMLLVRQQP